MAKLRKPAPGGESDRPAKKPKGFAMPAIRGSEEWRVWVERLLDHDRSSWPDLVDRALAVYAKSMGFKDPPPKR
jgi:hypothetical protein